MRLPNSTGGLPNKFIYPWYGEYFYECCDRVIGYDNSSRPSISSTKSGHSSMFPLAYAAWATWRGVSGLMPAFRRRRVAASAAIAVNESRSVDDEFPFECDVIQRYRKYCVCRSVHM